MHQLRRSNRIYTWGDDIPDPFIDFEELNLPSTLMSSLKEFGIAEPTPIQMQVSDSLVEIVSRALRLPFPTRIDPIRFLPWNFLYIVGYHKTR